jgi:hypothetical protein
MTLEQALQEIAEGDWRMSEWAEGAGVPRTVEAHMCGDSADGDPTWHVFDRAGCGWVSFELGWYEQKGDFDSYEGLIRLARALDAANAALDAALKED